MGYVQELERLLLFLRHIYVTKKCNLSITKTMRRGREIPLPRAHRRGKVFGGGDGGAANLFIQSVNAMREHFSCTNTCVAIVIRRTSDTRKMLTIRE